jgi:multiple sugar transport system ATP-binding protein
MAGVRLHELVRKFDDGPAAVAGVSLDVRDGEFMVLVGPSGCGKTTVLRMIAGLEEPTSGRVLIGGEDVTDLPPGKRDVAMVFQNYPHFTVRENIAFPLRMRRQPDAEVTRRVKAVAESLAIDAYLARRPAELSGGQRQRVALARALVREPAVFLFDEPLSNLDAQVRASTRAELIRLHRQLGATMIYVTHDQVEAMSMAGRVALLNQGRLEQCAPPLEVYRTPSSLFAARFLGTPIINTLDGRVEASGGGSRQHFVGAMAIGVAASPGLATLAFRPEDVRLSATETPWRAQVTLVEALGAESVVHARLAGGEEVRVRVSGAPMVEAGATVHLDLAADRVLVFGADGRLAGRGRTA